MRVRGVRPQGGGGGHGGVLHAGLVRLLLRGAVVHRVGQPRVEGPGGGPSDAGVPGLRQDVDAGLCGEVTEGREGGGG